MDPSLNGNLITTKDAGELSGYTPDYLARLVRSGKIAGKKIGHSWFVDRDSLSRFLDRQEARKSDYSRALAREREAEYRANRSFLNRATKKINSIQVSLPSAPRELIQRQIRFGAGWRSQAVALSAAFLVVVSAVFAAHAPIIPQSLSQLDSFARIAAFGFEENVTDALARGRAHVNWQNLSHKNTSNSKGSHRTYATLSVKDITIAPTPGLEMRLREVNLAGAAPRRAPPSSRPFLSERDAQDLENAILGTYALLSSPEHVRDVLFSAPESAVAAYRALGAGSYAAIEKTFSAYRALVDRSGAEALALAAATRDNWGAAPRLVSRINLAFGNSVIGLAHAAIRADVAASYALADAAPASAQATVAFIGGTGDLLAGAAAEAPHIAARSSMAAANELALAAPRLARAVFDAEYALAERFLAATSLVSDRYLALVQGTGNAAYSSLAAADSLARDPGLFKAAGRTLVGAYESTRGKGPTLLTDTLPAAVASKLSAGEKVALKTYQTITNFWDSATSGLAYLLSPTPAPVIVYSPAKKAPSTKSEEPNKSQNSKSKTSNVIPAKAQSLAPSASYSYPTYTTVVKGASEDYVKLSLNELKNDILSTVGGMLSPISRQTATNITTIQQVARIEKLDNLTINNGTFGGGTFDRSTLTNGISVAASQGTFGSLTISGGTIFSGNLVLASTTATAGSVLVNAQRFLHSYGTDNTFLGLDAGNFTMTGTQNTGIGASTLTANTTGLYNTAVGNLALNANTTGNYNTALGGYTLPVNTTGVHNTAVGLQVLTANTTGGYNTGLGSIALDANTTGDYNTAVGYQSVPVNTTGTLNTGIGYRSLYANTTGSWNVALGPAAGWTNTTGTYNTFLGYSADAASSTLTNATAIGANAIVGASNSLVLGGTGANQVNVGIGSTSPSALLSISGPSSGTVGTSPLLRLSDNDSTYYYQHWDFRIGSTTTAGPADGALHIDSTIGGSPVNIMTLTRRTSGDSFGVGIGTSTPKAGLQIVGMTPTLRLENTGAQNSTRRFQIVTGGYDHNEASIISGQMDLNNNDLFIGGNRSDQYAATVIRFFTAAATTTTTGTERMRITGDGNVGIGTTSPYSLLSISNAAGTTVNTPLFTIASTTGGTATSTLMTVLADGKVGIGTAAPLATLNPITAGGDTPGSNQVLALGDSLTGGLQTWGFRISTTAVDTNGGDLHIERALGGVVNTVMSLTRTGSAVGIGTTTPWGKLSVTNDGTRPSFIVEDSASPDTSPFIIDAAGNVGIGTTSPSSVFSVNGASLLNGGVTIDGAGSGITFSGTGNHDITAAGGTLRIGSNTIIGNIQALDDTVDIGTPSVRFDKIYANEVNATSLVGTIIGGNVEAETLTINSDNTTPDQESSYLAFERGSTSPNATLAWNAATSSRRFEFNQPLYIQDASLTSATSTLFVQGWSGQTSDLFRIASSSDTVTPYLTVTSSGNVGIGTTSPGAKLEVYQSSNLVTKFDSGSHNYLRLNRGALTQNNELEFQTEGTTNWALGLGDDSANNFYITTNNAAPSNGAKLTITTAGNIGIGTTSPYSLLTLYKAGATAANSPQLVFSASSTVSGVKGNFLNNWAVGTDIADGGKFKIASSSVIGTNDRFVIDGSGNVGIGTANPQSILHTYSANPRLTLEGTQNGGGATNELRIIGVNNGTAKFISFYNGTDELYRLGASLDSSAGHFRFRDGSNDVLTIEDNSDANMFYITCGAACGTTSKIGIGTTTPTSLLQVAGATAPKFTLSDTDASANQKHWFIESDSGSFNIGTTSDALATNASYRAVTINSSGNVGIGTTSPAALLDVHKDQGGVTELRISNMNASGPARTRLSFYGNDASISGEQGVIQYNNASSNFEIYSRASRSLSLGANGSVGNIFIQGNSGLGTVGNVGVGTTTPWGQLSASSTSAYPTLAIEQKSTGPAAVFLGGNVGIGSTSPTYELSINSTNASRDTAIIVDNTNNSRSKYLAFTTGNETRALIGSQSSDAASLITTDGIAYSAVFGSPAGYPVQFYTGTSAKMTISAAGNVGIGTTTPTLSNGGASGKGLHISNLTSGQDAGLRLETDNSWAFSEYWGSGAGKFITGYRTADASFHIAPGVALNTDTGLTMNSSGNIGIGSAPGTGALTVSGNVGIGTTSPYSLLSISNAVTTTANTPLLTIASTTGGTSTSTLMTVLASGNVGIGTASPGAKLQITGSADTQHLIVKGNSSQTANLVEIQDSSANILASFGNRVAQGDAALFVVNPSKQLIQDTMVEIYGYQASTGLGLLPSHDAPAGIAYTSPALSIVGDYAGTNIGGSLSYTPTSETAGYLSLSNDGTATLNVIKIDNATPRVGIGTTTGAAQLYVRTGINYVIGQVIEGASEQGVDYLQIRSNNSLNGDILKVSSTGNVGIGTTTPWGQLSASSTSAYPTLAIEQKSTGPAATFLGGNVGIGTTSPASLFSVHGNGLFSGNITAANITATGTLTAANISTTGYLSTSNAAVGGDDWYISAGDSGHLGFFKDSTAVSTNGKMVLTTGGLLGVGGGLNTATVPAEELEVYSSSGVTAIRITGDSNQGAPELQFNMRNGTANQAKIVGSSGESHNSPELQFYVNTGADSTNTLVQRMTINDLGKVGIGTTSPYSMLSISNAAGTAVNTPLLTIASTTAGNSTSTLMTVLASGNVGIGTAAPTYGLHVEKAAEGSYAAFIKNTDTNTNSSGLLIDTGNNTTSNYGLVVRTQNADRLLVGLPSTLYSTEVKTGLLVSGKTYLGNTAFWAAFESNAAKISWENDPLVFSGGSPVAEFMRITATGNVGIGDTDPSESKLRVASGHIILDNDYGIFAKNAAGTANTAIGFDSGTDDSMALYAGSAERVRITSSGNLGIGSTTPWGQLSASSTSAYPTLAIEQKSTGPAAVFLGGNVGIGTTSPSGSFNRILEIHDAASGGNAALELSQPTKKFGLAIVDTSLRIIDETRGAYPFAIDTNGKIGVTTITPQFTLSFGEQSTLGTLGWQYGNNAASRNWGIATDLDAFGALSFLTSSAKTDGLLDTTRMIISSAGNVGIGTTSPYAKLSVVGETVSQYFTATSTTATSTFSGGLAAASSLYVLQNGNVGIGTAAPSSPLTISKTWTDTGDTASISITNPVQNTAIKSSEAGISINSTLSGSANLTSFFGINSLATLRQVTSGVTGAKISIDADSASAYTNTMRGLNITSNLTNYNQIAVDWRGSDTVLTHNAAAKTLATAYGSKVSVTNSAGTISNWYGLYSDISNSGTITNTYGVYIDDVTSGTQTNQAYGLYQADTGARNYFGGNVGIGTTEPGTYSTVVSKLEVQGTDHTGITVDAATGKVSEFIMAENNVAKWHLSSRNTFDTPNYRFSVYEEGGAERIVILPTSGNVGIGTTSPYSLLTLYKAGATAANSPQLVFSASSTVSGVKGNFLNNWAVGTDLADGGKFKIASSSVIGTNDRFVIDGNGNVGIGTAGPVSALEISGTTGITWNTTSFGLVTIGDGSGGSLFVRTPTINSNYHSGLGVTGSYSAATLRSLVNINAYGVWENGYGSDLAFSTTKDKTLTEAMRIDTNGNVGIGTTTPLAKLHIKATTSTGPTILINRYDNDTNYQIGIGESYRAGEGGIIDLYTNGVSTTANLDTSHIRMTVGTNVGIGTTTPWGRLAITGADTGTTNALVIADSANSPKMVVQNNGNVGIGTTSPGSKLDVQVAGNSKILNMSTASAGTGYLYGEMTNTGGRLLFGVEAFAAGSVFGGSLSYSSVIGTNNSTALHLSTNNTVRATIDTAGNVGIGTTSPSSLFSVAGQGYFTGNVGLGINSQIYGGTRSLDISAGTTGDVQAVLALQGARTTNDPPGLISFYHKTTGIAEIQSYRDGADNSGGLKFASTNAGTAGVRMTIDKTGNVGIGTTSPYSLLTLYKAGATAANSPQMVFSASSTVSGVKGNFLNNWAIGTDLADGGKFKIASSSVIGTNDRFVIDGNGNVGIGTASPTSGKLQIQGINPSATADFKAVYAFAQDFDGGAGALTSITSLYGQTNIQSLATAATDVHAVQGVALNNLTAGITITNLYGVKGTAQNVQILGTTTNSMALAAQQDNTNGTTTNSFGLRVLNLVNSGGAITNTYGVHVGDITTGTQTNTPFSFYASDTNAYNYFAGNVGIGSTTPGTLLSLGDTGNDTINISATATSTFGSGLNIRTGCFAINGVCVGGGSGSGTINSGTAGQMPYYLANGTTLTATSTLFLSSNQRVGVASSTPFAKLSVENTGTSLSFAVNDQAGDPTPFTIDSGGAVGIGTASPGGQSERFSIVTTAGSASAMTIYNGSDPNYIGEFGIDASTGNLLITSRLVGSGAQPIYMSASAIGLGTTTPATLLEVGGATANVTFDGYKNCTGFTSNGNGLLACTASDERLKQEVAPLTSLEGLSAIEALEPVSFYWNPAAERAVGRQFGLVAQEVRKVFPDLVQVSNPTELTPDGTLSINYEGLAAPMILAIQELSARTGFIESAATSTVLTVDVAGRVGIGTTTPNHALEVAGDIGATGFVNTSTRALKTDINYMSASSTEAMLGKLKELKVATYRYAIDPADGEPLRLGLIAEDARELAPEILSPDGKGVDLYKLATFTLAGVQQLAEKVDAQEVRMTSLEARLAALESGAVSSGSPITNLISDGTGSSTLASAFQAFGAYIAKGIAQFGTLVADQFVAATNSEGASSAGTVTVLAGNTVAQVENAYVKPTTKIFVTFTASTTGSWYIAEKKEGSFRLVLEQPQTGDTAFDYFLIQTEGQMATSTPQTANSSQQIADSLASTGITVLGENPYRLDVGGNFNDPGIIAPEGASITTYINGVQMEVGPGTIDTSSATTYIITYSAVGPSGVTTATRTVIVGGGSVVAGSTQQTEANSSQQIVDSSQQTEANSSESNPPAGGVDSIAPVVTLNGEAAMQITVGGAFTDPGATAADDTDGDITAKIIVSGSVDAATVGSYTITYSATDAAGNAGSASRLVTVVAASATSTTTASTTP